MVKEDGKKTKAKKVNIKSKKNIIKIFTTLAFVVVFVFFGVTMVNQTADISRMKVQKDEISAKVDEQLEENEELQTVLDNEDKDEYIEQKAREKGYVKSNEIVFYDISASE